MTKIVSCLHFFAIFATESTIAVEDKEMPGMLIMVVAAPPVRVSVPSLGSIDATLKVPLEFDPKHVCVKVVTEDRGRLQVSATFGDKLGSGPLQFAQGQLDLAVNDEARILRRPSKSHAFDGGMVCFG